MSGPNYNGRRAPNFSQYLSDLNTIPSPYDQTVQQQDLFDVDAELALFTNAEFLHFDNVGGGGGPGASAGGGEISSPQSDVKLEEAGKPDTARSDTTAPSDNGAQDLKYMDMLNDFNIPNYPDYSSPMIPIHTSTTFPTHPSATAHNGAAGLAGGDVSHQVVSPVDPSTPRPQTSASLKRKAESAAAAASASGSQSLDEDARMAQEEDKRRRNTAASARFRIKKKEREKNMERTVKDVTAKNATLEARITQLEMENRWLKNLITEKNGPTTSSDGDISGLFRKFQETNQQQAQAK